jgi:hypothetical protein
MHRIPGLTLQHRREVLKTDLYVAIAKSQKLRIARMVPHLVPAVMPLVIVAQPEPPDCSDKQPVVEPESSVDLVSEVVPALQ